MSPEESRDRTGPSQPNGGKPSILSGTLHYVTGKTVAGGLSVLASIVVYRLLGPREAGQLQFCLALAMTVGALSGLGFYETLARFVPGRSVAEGAGLFRRAWRWNLLSLALVAAIFLALLLLDVGLPEEIRAAPVLFLVYVAGYSLYQTCLGMLRGRARFRTIPTLDLGGNLGAKAGSAALVLLIPTYAAALGVHALVQLAVLTGAWILLRDARRYPETGFHRAEITFGFLIVVSILVRVLVQTVDIYVLRFLLGPTDVGIFAAGSRIPRLVEQLVIGPIGVPLLYYFSHPDSTHRSGDVVRRGTRITGALVGPAVLVLAIVAEPLVLLFLGEAFRESIPIVRVYGAHTLGAALVVFTGPLYASQNRLQFVILQGLAVFLINLGLDLWLVPKWGTLGAAVAGTISLNGVAIAAAFFVTWKFDIDLRRPVLVNLLLFAPAFILVLAGKPWLGLVLYLPALVLFRLVRREDLRFLKRRRG